MKALTWQGKNSVKVVETACPKIIDEGDVILKVTGSTICGSDLHLFHEAIPDLQKGDILGHEFCGIIASVGPAVKKVKWATARWLPSKLPAESVIIARKNYPRCVSGQIRARKLISYMGVEQPVCSGIRTLLGASLAGKRNMFASLTVMSISFSCPTISPMKKVSIFPMC